MSLGEKTFLCLFSVRGEIPKKLCAVATKRVISSIGMTPIFRPKTWRYPDKSVGYIHAQPIYESFVTWDVWPKYNGAYLAVCSCKQFCELKVKEELERIGLKVLSIKKVEASLKDGE